MPVADVLMVDDSPLRVDSDLVEDQPPLSKQLEVAPGISLAGVRPEIAEQVMAATGFHIANPQYRRAMYAFVRYDPPGREWDSDNEIAKLLFLSHFVKANEAGFEYTARIVTADSGRLESIDSGSNVAPPFARAYCTTGARRRWLTQDDGVALRDLLVAYRRVHQTLAGTRVGLAISTFAESPFVYHGRPRALLLVTILEGLVSTMPQRATKQFTTRVPVLAQDVGLPELDKPWAEETYQLRSKLAHGGSVLQSANEMERQTKLDGFNETLTRLDELLRRLLRRALLDDAFRARIENIDTHLPVPGQGCPVCRLKDPSLIAVPCPSCQRAWS